MFKKIVSNLPFSPSLVGHLELYLKELNKAEKARFMALVFISLTVLLQVISFIQPINTNTNSTYVSSKTTSEKGIEKSVKAVNSTKHFIDAASTKASASDQISYTLNISNTNKTPVTTAIDEPLADILEYGVIIDKGGGNFDEKTKTISWNNISINPNNEQSRTFIVKILDTIPSTARGNSNADSFDCEIKNNYGNSINIQIDCPFAKTIENTISQLPIVNSWVNIVLDSALIITALILYTSTRQLKKEIRLIRKDINAGTI